MNLETEVKELKKEVSRLSTERDGYMTELGKRPFEVKSSAEIVDTNNHPSLTNTITEALNKKERILAKVRIEGERLWCIVIGRSDSHNANFDDSEEGQIFVGVLSNEPINDKLSFNDLIEFQSCDVFEVE